MPNELKIADIQQAFFEYRANFKELVTGFWFGGKQGEVIRALHKALSQWQVGLENVTWNPSAKNVSEVQLTFAVPSVAAAIQVGLSGLTMSAFNPDWSRAPVFVALNLAEPRVASGAGLLSLFQTAVDAVKGSTAQEFQAQLITLGFHIRPMGAKTFKEVMSSFVNAKALSDGEDAFMYGVSVYSNDYSYVIDSSAVIPGGIFIKLIRNFSAESSFEQMATILFKDEENVLRRLGLKLQ